MSERRTAAEELLCLALLFAFLLWVPLPFGSTPDEFQLPLVAGATTVCAATAVVIARSKSPLTLSAAHRTWTVGAVAFMLLVALQLVEMPAPLLRIVSAESARIWANADSVASLVVGPLPASHPISIDPQATLLHLYRLLAYFATFTAAALLVRRYAQRVAFAAALGVGALFQTGYGLREAWLHRFSIWGWKNTLIFDRVTGTFVNPNHFAHYAALVAPFGAFILGLAWHDAAAPSTRLFHRIVRVTERRVLPAAFGALVVVSCILAILISKSRGALFSLFAGATIALAAPAGRSVVRTVMLLAAAAMVVVVVTLYLGVERTSITRLTPAGEDIRAVGGRRTGAETALAIWKRYPVFGSGLGTFEALAPMAQPDQFQGVYTHAHDDYAEIAATTGTVGIAVFLLAVSAGMRRFVRSSFSSQRSWRHRAFNTAVLASLATALTHALVDFNFFIPANAVTLAAIAGAAVATRSEPASGRDSGLDDSQA